ncbi:hypothetical protein N7474_001602 [Penicillium riverlandense]|uniref:uncharacterized protein n=1 Tax=Penicillium riverlandense TaxID=1903569 RepID=UPI002547AF78|nr:uncharacterized protein N7474_001602 [Penicillium riverlandense]KAJ5833291.1 hypothetical protein N7474_001602 [Penicillium riverlandense]
MDTRIGYNDQNKDEEPLQAMRLVTSPMTTHYNYHQSLSQLPQMGTWTWPSKRSDTNEQRSESSPTTARESSLDYAIAVEIRNIPSSET